MKTCYCHAVSVQHGLNPFSSGRRSLARPELTEPKKTLR